MNCLAHTDCKFGWKVFLANGEQMQDLVDESFYGTYGFIFEEKQDCVHTDSESKQNVSWIKKTVLAELVSCDRVAERQREMLADPRYKNAGFVLQRMCTKPNHLKRQS